MRSLVIENGGWEVRTTGNVEGNTIRFTAHCPVWERIAFKCKVRAEIIRRGRDLEIILVHNKILPSIVKDAIQNMAMEVLQEHGISLEPVLRLVSTRPMQNMPIRKRA